jgi:hypothetical protein
LIAKEFPDVPEMQERIGKSLEDYAYAYVANEIQGVLDEIRQGSLEVPETLRVRSVVRNAPQLPNITVEAPQISMPSITVTVPERSVETPVLLSPPDMAPAEVNVNVPERSVTVNVPEQASPIVNVNVPEQPAPTIEVKSADVNVTVQPTPVEITNPVTVNVPRPVKEHQTVQRDVNGDISTTETYIIYEDK